MMCIRVFHRGQCGHLEDSLVVGRLSLAELIQASYRFWIIRAYQDADNLLVHSCCRNGLSHYEAYLRYHRHGGR